LRVIVPDASVILKWVLAGEDRVEEAKSLAILNDWLEEKIRLLLPTLWLYEVGNVLGLKRPKQAGALLEVLIDYRFEEVDVTKDISLTALKLMNNLNVSFYDAAYHVLAIRREGNFITADKKYWQKAKKIGHIELLTEL